MDKKDRQIIAALQKEGRLTNQELSERVNLSPSPCLRRLRLLEEAGVIRGYTAIVDEEAYGLPVTAFVHIRLQQHTREVVATFENRIRAIDAILDCYVLTGEADYLLREPAGLRATPAQPTACHSGHRRHRHELCLWCGQALDGVSSVG